MGLQRGPRGWKKRVKRVLLNVISLARVGDGAYDKTAVYDAVTERGAMIVVPPTKKARVSRSDAAGALARNATVESVRDLGRRCRPKLPVIAVAARHA